MNTESTMEPKNILALSTREKRKLFDSIDYIFSGIDGVIWNVDELFEEAAAGFIELQHMGKKITFLSNNSSRKPQSTARQIRALGVDVNENDIWHPARSIVEYLKSINFDGLIYIMATESFKNVLKESGFKLIDGPSDSIKENWRDLLSNVVAQEPVEAVIIDYDHNMTSLKLARAHRYLRKPNCQLIIGASDMLLSMRKNFELLGPGQYSRILVETCSNKVANLGKPGKELGELLRKLHGIQDAQRVLMIGDMLEQDVAFGRICGFQTLAVLSGGCSLEDINAQVDTKHIPNYYANNVGDFVEFISEINNSRKNMRSLTYA